MVNLRLKVIRVVYCSEEKKSQVLATVIESTNGPVDKNLKGSQPRQINLNLEGIWTQNKLVEDSIVHIINPEYEKTSDTYLINNSKGFLVNEPDTLLTCTHVASSLFCERKTWLNHVFQGQVGTNKAMLVGTLVHEVFQHGVRNNVSDVDKLIKFLDDLLDDADVMLQAYSVEQNISDIRTEAISYIGSVKEWIDKYLFSGPMMPLTNDSNLEVKIIGITDIEENVWSTKYGLKGKIDVTGSVRVYDKRTKTTTDKTIPLELKTGNPNLSASHAAQVSLYSMMIEDRYSETNQGFVIYLKDKAAMHNIALTHNIKRDLIQRRNQVASHMRSYYFGPDMLNQSRICKGCDRLTECLLISDLYSPGQVDEYDIMKSLRSEALGHLDKDFQLFFQKYHEKIVALMTGARAFKKFFWNHTSEEAEEEGTGFGKLIISELDEKKGLITFKRNNNMSFNPTKKMKLESPNKNSKPFNTNHNFARCQVAISLDDEDPTMETQNSSTALAMGFINQIEDDQFLVKVFDGSRDWDVKADRIYRVDKIEKKSHFDIERLVLVRLLAREDWRCDRVRQLILDPSYKPARNVEFNLFVLSAGFEEISNLRVKQQKLVVEAISTDNYYIINEDVVKEIASANPQDEVHKVVSVLIKIVTTLDRTILIVAPNLDNLLGLMECLQKKKIKFILISDGKSEKARFKFAKNLVKVLPGENFALKTKYEAYIRQHELAPVVITTYAMSIGGLLFTRRTFDYCIAYDCDKTELLLSLSPMFCSDRHIIIDKKTNSGDEKDVSLGEHLRMLR